MSGKSSKPRAAEARIGWLTLVLGAAGAIAAGLLVAPQTGLGVAVGAALAWLNHRWLGQSLDAVTRAAAAQADAPQPRVPRWTYAKFIARYGLIAVVLYVMFSRFDVSVVSMLCGLLTLGAAAMVEGVYEAISR